MKILTRHILVGGLLGFGPLVTIALLVLEAIDTFLAPYWWLLGPVLWLVAGVTFGCIRWLLRRRERAQGAETKRQRRLRPVLAGLGTIPAVFLLLLVAAPSIYVWDGMYQPARYTFVVVDPDDRPLADVEFIVHTSEGLAPGVYAEREDRTPSARSFSPIKEFGGQPLRTDARGRLVVQQVGIWLGGSGYTVFAIDFENEGYEPEYTFEFRHHGYNSRVLKLCDLNRLALREDERRRQASESRERRLEVEVRVVLEPE